MRTEGGPGEGCRRLLIVALSARALARSARRAGLRPIALDAFADLDLREAAERCRRLPLTAEGRFAPRALRAAARSLAPPPMPLLYGSGFERDAALLAELAAGRRLLGTAAADLARAKDPFRFAAVCRRLGLPHPELRRTPPPDPAGWLEKRPGGAGGGHVRPAAAHRHHRDGYFQRRMPGVPVSALLLGDGRRARVLGFARQWTAPGWGFRFAGVSLPLDLPGPQAARLAAAARAVAVAFRLRGLGSVDFLLAGRRFWLLELNPRPTAALEAWELACDVSLCRLHIAACRGRLAPRPRVLRAAASEIVFAPRALRMPEGFPWPSWARDRSPPGTRIAAGGPVCTVVATAADARAARAQVRRRRAWMRARLLDPGRAAA